MPQGYSVHTLKVLLSALASHYLDWRAKLEEDSQERELMPHNLSACTEFVQQYENMVKAAQKEEELADM